MKKKNQNNAGFLVALLLIILAGAVIFALETNYFKNQDYKENKFDEIKEKENLENVLDNYNTPLSSLIVKTIVDKYNKSGKYEIMKNTDLFSIEGNKQFFVSEYLVETNKNVFIVLNGFNNEVDNTATPTDDATIAYSKIDDFNKAYKEIFDEEFKISKKEVSASNNEYDKSNEYVYYNNKRIGTNGMKANITLNNITYENDTYKANVTISYSDRLKEVLNYETDTAVLSYEKNDEKIYLTEFTINK